MSYIVTAALSSLYAAWLSTREGKEWVDRNTTLAVVLGVGGVLVALRGVLDRHAWLQVFGLFAAAGAPLIVRGALRRLLLLP
jgi:drug/metabolite transporter (DMT)-like permease